jgi:hypothetical protein
MSAAEKLRALDAGFVNTPLRDELWLALPQIVALVSLVEKERNLVSGEIGDALDELERAVT